ncbi:helix-turn-helix transcriptional regulator [Ruminococcus sp.]|uniref:helix-turn-helix domain-containing protein n=1 Tax=Ruminococcus sp. TaxID=41978 RepID=UPI0025FA927A|nr:helix-turn-helix transcriptional regulator [Ruminococcus sp.]MBQ9541943.1 helix-turn-helix transcriptional regulator [Ruminococcus sp.]
MENLKPFSLGNTFGKQLTDILKDKGLTVAKLSELSGVNESTISSYKTGKNYKEPKLENAINIAIVLGVSVEKLCGLPEIKQASQNIENDICKTIRALSHIMDMGILSFNFNDSHDLIIYRVSETYHDDLIVNNESAFQNDILDFIEEYLKISETLKDAEYSDYKKLCLNACIDKYIDMFTPKFGNK